MTEFLNLDAEENQDENMVSEDEDLEKCNKVSLDSFIDDSIQKNDNPSAYYGFTNITRTYSSDEEDAFSEFDIRDFLDEDVETSNYCVQLNMSDKEEDVFIDSKRKVVKLKDTLLIPNGKYSIDYLFYVVYYAVRYEKMKKNNKEMLG